MSHLIPSCHLHQAEISQSLTIILGTETVDYVTAPNKATSQMPRKSIYLLPKSDFSYIWHIASINLDFWVQIYERYVYTELFNEQRGHKYICNNHNYRKYHMRNCYEKI